MREIEKPFNLELDQVSEHKLQGKKRAFHVHFNYERKPLILAVGLSQRQEKFWTSLDSNGVTSNVNCSYPLLISTEIWKTSSSCIS